jgi:hypothetical protein
LEILVRIIVSFVILALLALEGSYVYFWIARRGKHTSLNQDPCYAEIKKCPVCGGVVQDKKEAKECASPQCLEHRPV